MIKISAPQCGRTLRVPHVAGEKNQLCQHKPLYATT